MNPALLTLLSGYPLKSPLEYEHALREVLQHLALLGLWRSRFYEHAAFYGDTALRIKMEVDTDPPAGAEYESRTVLSPIPFQVRLYTPSALFAGKVHALLYRQWKTRVKGRDFFDFVWFVGRRTPCHLGHLSARMVQTGHWTSAASIDRAELVRMLEAKFASLDVEQARDDVRPFVRDPDSLALWSREFFADCARQIRTV